MILPNTDIEGATTIAEDVRASVEALKIKHEFSSASHHVSISVGVANGDHEECGSEASLISRADEALYAAKGEGRNRCQVYSAGCTQAAVKK